MQDPDIDFSLIIASSVHDMKNSVSLLMASLETLSDDFPAQNDQQQKRYTTLHYQASRINRELVQLLNIYRMNNDLLPIRRDDHLVRDLLEDQVARNHELISSAGIELGLECPEGLYWFMDEELVGSIVQNVIVNASRYAKSRLFIQAQALDGQLCLSIADDGDGFPAQMLAGDPQEHIAKPGGMSTQLGLYFAEQIAGRHVLEGRAGSIQLSNGGPLGGGVFKLFLP